MSTRPLLKDLADNIRTDKNTVHSYLDTYERYFSPIRDTAKNVLEVGVRFGGSIKLWHDYFPNATVYGIDNMADVKEMWSEITNKQRIKLLTPYNAYDENLIHVFKSSNITFDMLLDDGPHTPESMCFFATHYSPLLTSTGVMVIEDIQDPAWIPQIVEAFPAAVRPFVRVIDLRQVKGRYDDLLIVLDMSLAQAPAQAPAPAQAQDTVVAAVIAKFAARSADGQKKYGTTLDRTDLGTRDWIRHTQEELMDAILYLERLSRSV